MTTLILAAYLIVVGLIDLTSLHVASWVPGLLALVAGILLLVGPNLAKRFKTE